MQKKLSILITGGSGLLAINWAQSMSESCNITLGLHNREILFPQVFSKKINLESVDDLQRTIETFGFETVVHTAGLANVEQCESNPTFAHHVNVILASNVAKACNRLNTKLVHISSDHLFSGKDSLVTENHPTSPRNIYAKTKAEAESRVLESNSDALVIRTNFFGWGTAYRHSFSDKIIESLRLNKQMALFQDVFYTPILIEHAVKIVHDLINLKVSGIFHVVGNDRISKYEFGLRVAEVFGFDSSKLVPTLLANNAKLTQRPFDMSLSNKKVRNLLSRPILSTPEQIMTLYQQECKGLAKELQKI